jgi:hypothetical protein
MLNNDKTVVATGEEDNQVENNNGNEEKNQVKNDIVTINVSGVTYELDTDDIRRAPSSLIHKNVFGGKCSLLFLACYRLHPACIVIGIVVPAKNKRFGGCKCPL